MSARLRIDRKLIFAAAALLLLFGGTGLWLWAKVLNPQLNSSDIAQLQRLAVKSCLCERSGGSEDACWSDYRQDIPWLGVETMASSCEPISTTLNCFDTQSGQQCVVVSYGLEGVCTENEARAVEQAWYGVFEGVDFDDEAAVRSASDRADEAMSILLARIQRGEKVSAPPFEGGCA